MGGLWSRRWIELPLSPSSNPLSPGGWLIGPENGYNFPYPLLLRVKALYNDYMLERIVGKWTTKKIVTIFFVQIAVDSESVTAGLDFKCTLMIELRY